MPPSSRELWEEGAVISAFKVIENGIFKEDELTELLMAPSKFPGCKGTRCLKDNISDIKAQAAANHRGSLLIHNLIDDYGLEAVQFYSAQYLFSCVWHYSENVLTYTVDQIQGAAERAVRDMLRHIYRTTDGSPLKALDYMDDGTAIQLKVTIDENTGGAIFDFNGTGPEAYG